MKDNVLNRFLRYVKINTQSDESSTTFPSSRNQFDLARLLVKELKEFGLEDAYVNDNCYVFATLQANCSLQVPTIALFAHLDTSPEVSGANVNPKIIDVYPGGDIILNGNKDVVIRASDNPHLFESIGHTLVTTDGTTLLGSDDKAGIAAIMTTIEYLTKNKHILHGPIRVCFTPDEETGNGIANFDLDELNADYGYTVDGGFTGEINKETFSADSATVDITGIDMHPGYAKNKMVNSTKILAFILSLLPESTSPENTSDYQPYIHPVKISGAVSKSTISFILRDFTDEGLLKLHTLLDDIISKAQHKFPLSKITVSYKSTYRNMSDSLKKVPHVTTQLENAVKSSGVTPIWKPIRGGTDGSKLTALGLPTPNIFTASCNSHSLTEWQSIDGLVNAVETLVHLVKID